MFFKNLNILKQKSNTTNNKHVYRRNHSEYNVSRFKNSLSRVNWSEVLDGVDTKSVHNHFFKTNLMNWTMNLFHWKNPKTNRKKIPQSPWITKGLLKSIIVKNKLYKQYLLCPTEGNSVKFRSYRNKFNLIRKCKQKYYHTKFEKKK